jgi:hypothetical protein
MSHLFDSFLKVIFVLFVAKNMDNTLCCGYGSDAGCRFLPARHREPLSGAP